MNLFGTTFNVTQVGIFIPTRQLGLKPNIHYWRMYVSHCEICGVCINTLSKPSCLTRKNHALHHTLIADPPSPLFSGDLTTLASLLLITYLQRRDCNFPPKYVPNIPDATVACLRHFSSFCTNLVFFTGSIIRTRKSRSIIEARGFGIHSHTNRVKPFKIIGPDDSFDIQIQCKQTPKGFAKLTHRLDILRRILFRFFLDKPSTYEVFCSDVVMISLLVKSSSSVNSTRVI